MPYAYPPHLTTFDYVGRHSYAVEFTTDGRAAIFTEAETVNLVYAQFQRAAGEKLFAIIAYCFMPDHVHLVVTGRHATSDCLAFIKAAKQYSGYYFKQQHLRRLWQRYGYERAIRDEMELALTIRYVLANPVKAGLASHPSEYPFLGSDRYTIDELLQWCEYSDACALE